MNKQVSLTRTCSACGIEKPLAAFLQVSGKQGSVYGTICSACRGQGITERVSNQPQDEDHGSTSSEVRIGAKQKFEIDKEKIRQFQKLKNIHKKIKKQREQQTIEKLELSEDQEKAEKFHRSSYIEAKRHFFQDNKSQTTQITKQIKKNALFSRDFVVNNKARTEAEVINLANALFQDERMTKIDLSGAPIFDQQHAVISRNNPVFKRFMAWLGTSAPIMRTLSQLYNNPTVAKENKSYEKPGKDPLIDYVNKTWGPGRRR